MPDTQLAQSIASDTPFPRITTEALDRAMARTGSSQFDELAQKIGLSRQTFWRARRGTCNIRLVDARRVAKAAGLRVERCFEGGTDV